MENLKSIQKKSCCFTGHRKLSEKKISHIITRLNEEIEVLIQEGVTDFISGGALGFDQIAAKMIIDKKKLGADIRLIFALPCRNQDGYWTVEQKRLYHSLLCVADEVRYISEEYSSDSMKKRNYYMIDQSDYCICALIHNKTGTGQTVRYAQEKGLRIINVAQ